MALEDVVASDEKPTDVMDAIRSGLLYLRDKARIGGREGGYSIGPDSQTRDPVAEAARQMWDLIRAGGLRIGSSGGGHLPEWKPRPQGPHTEGPIEGEAQPAEGVHAPVRIVSRPATMRPSAPGAVPVAIPPSAPAAPATGAVPDAVDLGSEAPLPPQVAAPAVVPAPTDQPAAQPAAETLQDMYRRVMAGIPARGSGNLTPEQKNRQQLDFFLRLMAGGARPGARFLGTMGEAGLATNAAADAQRKENLAASNAELQRLREDAFRTVGLADKDADNRRADARTATEERRWKAQEEQWKAGNRRDQERLDLERKRLEQEGKAPLGHQMLGNGNIGVILKNGSVVDTGVKGRAPASEQDPLTRSIEALRRLFPKESNEDLLRRYMGTKRDTTRGELSEDEMAKLAADMVGKSMGGLTYGEALRQIRAEHGKGGTGIARPTTRAEFDALPSGTRFINPADGQGLTKK